ncbi:MAG: hypothetical protein WC707_03795 [Candidatus Babeliaceae bacterium]
MKKIILFLVISCLSVHSSFGMFGISTFSSLFGFGGKETIVAPVIHNMYVSGSGPVTINTSESAVIFNGAGNATVKNTYHQTHFVHKKYFYGGALLLATAAAVWVKICDYDDSWPWVAAKSIPCFMGLAGGLWGMYRGCNSQNIVDGDELSVNILQNGKNIGSIQTSGSKTVTTINTSRNGFCVDQRRVTEDGSSWQSINGVHSNGQVKIVQSTTRANNNK